MMELNQYTENGSVSTLGEDSYLIGGITDGYYPIIGEVGYDELHDHPIYDYSDKYNYYHDYRLYFINNDFYIEYGIDIDDIKKGVYKIYSKDSIKRTLNQIQEYGKYSHETNCIYDHCFRNNYKNILEIYETLSKRDDSYEFNKFNDLFKTIILYENTHLDNSFDMGIDEAEKYLNSLNDVLKYSKNKQEISKIIDEVNEYISYLKVKYDMNVLTHFTCDYKIFNAYRNRWNKPKSMENALWISEVVNSTSNKNKYEIITLIYYDNDFYFVSKEKDSTNEFSYRKVDSIAELNKFFNNSFVKDEIAFKKCLNNVKDKYKNQFIEATDEYNILLKDIMSYEDERINSDNDFDVNCFTLLVENNDFETLNNLITNYTDELSKISVLDDFYFGDNDKKSVELRIKNFIDYLNNLKEIMLLTKNARELNIINIDNFINRWDDTKSNIKIIK